MDCFKLLETNQVDCFILHNEFDKRYLTNFSGSSCQVIIKKDGIHFVTDGRYKTQIKVEISDDIKTYIVKQGKGYKEIFNELFNDVKVVGVDNTISVEELTNLENNHPQVIFKAMNSFITPMRMCKTDKEVELIKESIKVSEKTFDQIIDFIKPGMSERQVRAQLESLQLLNGADDYSFDSIIASGENSAKPHASFSDRIINEGDILTIDFGCIKNGYCSDITRTFFVGEPSNLDLVRMHDLVRECMELQISHIKPGVVCKEIDAIGREFFKKHEVEQYFIHATGHGLGMEVHESPYLNQACDILLEPGMIITVEPGLYVEGLGGIRIEQDVLVTKEGHEVLTSLDNSYNIYNERK